MTDQIPADLHPDDVALASDFAEEYRDSEYAPDRTVAVARVLSALLPAPPPPTLADMTLDEQDECAGMQADLAQGDRVVILDGTPDAAGLVQVLEKSLDVYRAYPAEVTPRPDLPRMGWPGVTEAAPVPALPDGWRLADHKRYGRVVVTRPEPDVDGEATIIRPVPTSIDRARIDWCRPDELTYIDQEADTATGPGHLAVGTVIESADDPRIAALPAGSALLDRDDDAVAKWGEMWAGDGYHPDPDEGDELGPWTVLHIPKEADQ